MSSQNQEELKRKVEEVKRNLSIIVAEREIAFFA